MNNSKVQFSFLKKSKSLSAGVLSQFFLPLFFGNLIGRLSYIDKSKRVEVGVAILWSNLAQYIPTLIFGALGLCLWEEPNLKHNLFDVRVYWAFISCAVIVLVLFFYFSTNNFFSRIAIVKKYFSLENSITFDFKLRLLLYSSLRYFGFVFQYFLMLSVFEDLNFKIIAPIMVMYLCLTMIPSVFFGKLGIREVVSVAVIGIYLDNVTLAVTCSLLVWFINNGIALVPSFIINSKNI